jgi:hypothetical protein
MQINQHLVQEIRDSYCIPCGMNYFGHVTATRENYVGIGMVGAILMLILVLVIAGMITGGI